MSNGPVERYSEVFNDEDVDACSIIRVYIFIRCCFKKKSFIRCLVLNFLKYLCISCIFYSFAINYSSCIYVVCIVEYNLAVAISLGEFIWLRVFAKDIDAIQN